MTVTHSPRSLGSPLARAVSSPSSAAARVSPSSGSAVRQMVRFGAIGVVSTAAYVGLYAALRNIEPAATANAVALVVTAVGNTAANRRLTLEVRGRDGLALHHAVGVLALVVALSITSASLGILQALAPRHGRLTEIAVLVAANPAATVVRFVLLRIAIACTASTPAHVPAPAPARRPLARPGPVATPAVLPLANLSAPQRTRG
jgi:putative flippase GtrA